MTRHLLPLASLLIAGTALAQDNQLVYFGTYTNPASGSKGVYVSRFNAVTGEISKPELAGETLSPSFVAIHPAGKFLYAVGEQGSGQKNTGAISAFRIVLPGGRLELVNQVDVGGAGPCYVSLDKTAKVAMTAQYSGGSVSSFRIGDDGALSNAVSVIQHQGSGADPKRQAAPHAHSIRMAPDNKYAVACDLGLDKVLIYRVDLGTGELVSHGFGTVPPGSGPRHLAFHPNGHFAFVNNEMKMTVSTMAYDGVKGALTLADTVSTIPAEDRGMAGLSTAETVVHPNGKFVYVSNRGHDTVAVLRCDAATGKLTLVANVKTEGKTPRNFALDLTGKWMIAGHQNGNSAAVFKVDPESGIPSFTGAKVEVGSPVCMRFLAVP
jgi:6-phosphogluconolactonase